MLTITTLCSVALPDMKRCVLPTGHDGPHQGDVYGEASGYPELSTAVNSPPGACPLCVPDDLENAQSHA